MSVAVLAGLLLVDGCGSVNGATSPSLPETAQSADLSPSPAPTGHGLGDTVQANSGFVAATVFGYTQPAASGAAPDRPGDAWATADVQACAATGSLFRVTISDASWSLLFPDGSTVHSSRMSAPQFPQPQYPSTPESLQAGQCVRAWIMFAVPADSRPDLIRYAPQNATPIDWLVE